MTDRQRTFDLIPTTLTKKNASKPPMTSKAAKKAYLQAQRGPKISKAEQRKRDAEEYERIRKEHEKEKNAAKARAAREKKAAKALAEKEARKKLGLPEPSRFVRASQPTISIFVKGASSVKRSWKEMKEVAEDIGEPGAEAEESDGAQRPAKRVAVDQESEDEFGDFPSLSQSSLEKIVSSAASVREGVSAPPSPEKKQNCEPKLCSPKASQELRAKKPSEDEFPFEDEDLTELVTTQLLSEAAEAASISDALEPLAPPLPAPVPGPQKHASNELFATPVNFARNENKAMDSEKLTKSKVPSILKSRSVLQERSINMLPPRLPIKKAPVSFADPILKPQIIRQKSSRFAPRPAPSIPPSSTQAFLENHLDDFFPSPSQQVRELLDDLDDIPSNTQVAKELGPAKPVVIDHFDGLICTQDFVLTPQDLEEIITPSGAPAKTLRVLEKRQQAKAAPARPASRDRPRFFEEKEDDLYQAALHESKVVRTLRPRGQSSDFKHAVHPASMISTERKNARERRFFEEKPDDILHAVLHESKISAAEQAKPAATKAPPTLRKETSKTDYGNFDFTGFFEDEEQKMIQAAVEESAKMAGLETRKVPLKEAPQPQQQKRTLKRVQSAATDYGDDEFSGCSQELLALC